MLDIEQAAQGFGALGDPTRLRLLRRLCSQRRPSSLCVNALANFLGVTPSAVSQHLKVLRSIGLVRGERRGQRVHYYVDSAALARYRALLQAMLVENRTIDEESCRDGCPDAEGRGFGERT